MITCFAGKQEKEVASLLAHDRRKELNASGEKKRDSATTKRRRNELWCLPPSEKKSRLISQNIFKRGSRLSRSRENSCPWLFRPKRAATHVPEKKKILLSKEVRA